jgi:cyclopropane-fatty-acyl-phospholipid synthase
MDLQFLDSKKEQALARILEKSGVACEVQYPNLQKQRFGSSPPLFRLVLHNDKILQPGLDEFLFSEAYVNGDIDIEGDMEALMKLRNTMGDHLQINAWLKFIYNLFFRNSQKLNREVIHNHYQEGEDLYLSYIDRKYRFYTEGIFKTENDTLEMASEHKLENIAKALNLKPGMRLLDVGGGWGGVAQYFGDRGIQVTELTLGEDSYQYMSNLIKEKNLPCKAVLQDFLAYTDQEPFDAIVACGVIEHIIDYAAFCEKVWNLLKPGGTLYLDASATIVKFDISNFARQYIWTGTHTFLCLQEFLDALLKSGLELVKIENESEHYKRTMHEWARRLEENKEKIISGYGEAKYRAFRLYLWAGSQAFPTHLQAYSLIAKKCPEKPKLPSKLQQILGMGSH